ncbi:hypothetical protein [Pseudomonas sp. CG7]|uniref:hypothetical protein n=1 Tax=unclassified Pseudomonas TaxID=196821 RepID=UPI002033FE1C|nr:hypothetical protein [Pseudomonas sp. CG7]MCM2464458.1 hypothetical protein [Pseudomonas sp. CG7]
MPSSETQLPVPQIKESHDLHIYPRPSGPTITAVIAPYRAMQVGDVVTLKFEGYDDTGELDEVWRQPKTLEKSDIDKPLLMNIPRDQIDFIGGGHALISYTVDYVGTGICGPSMVQSLGVTEPTTPLAPLIEIEGLSGDTLDPTQFPDGITLRVAPYGEANIGDGIALYWWTSSLDKRVVQAFLLDPSNIQSEVLLFRLSAPVLQASMGEAVQVFYQYARAGVAQTSQVLELRVRAPLDLKPPSVEGATAEGMPGDNLAFLTAESTTQNGAFVTLPASLAIGAGDRVAVHWQGDRAGGMHVATQPFEPGNPRRFQVPVSAIAANMEASDNGDAKRFPVFYRFTPAGEGYQDSDLLHLRIKPLPIEVYPTVQCTEVVGNRLSLRDVHETGANVTLARWSFIAPGQQLTIRAHGISTTSNPISFDIRRPSVLVTTQEALNGIRDQKLSKAFLQQLKLNSHLRFAVTVSFDGGKTNFNFPSLDNIQVME